MRLTGRTRLVGAYVCPRGAFAIECRRAGAGLAIERSLEEPAALESPFQAADHVISVLRTAGIKRGDVALAIRGFGVVHHVLQMPPAKDEMLSPIIEREVRRLEPQLGECVVSWIPLPSLESGGPEAGPQRSLLTAAVPTDVVQVFEQRLGAAGYRVLHLTALPAAMQRLAEEFDASTDAVAMVAPLPDGAFLGFALNGGLRLIVEPPLPPGVEHEVAAIAEEVELGAMFVRQQFRGAQIDRLTVVGTTETLADAESVLSERVHVPAKRLNIQDLSPAALAALGAVLDEQSAKPLALGGSSRKRSEARARSTLDSISHAAVLLLVLVGAWTITETVLAKRAADALQVARRRIEQDSFGLAPLRSTAGQRRLVRNAVAAVRLVSTDRVQLQETLTGIATVVRPPVRLDSLRLARGSEGWLALLGGSVTGVTNARAVQSLHDLYRELPERLSVDSIRLDQLTYADSAADSTPSVRFQLSFGIPSPKKD